MNVTRREWLQIFGLAAFLWVVIGAVVVGLVTLAAAMGPIS